MKKRLIALLAVLILSPLAAWCTGISPAKLEINLGPFPVDKYFALNVREDGSPIIPSCPVCWTVQQCVKGMFNSNSGSHPYNPFFKPNYVGQGVTGVRFMFDLGGGEYSTPFDSSGNVRSTWVTNFTAFVADLQSFGIQRVTPTPIIHSPFSSCPSAFCTQRSDLTTCGATKTLNFYNWLPFGLNTDGSPDQPDNNSAYNCANENPNFWGWNPFYALLRQILWAVYHTNGLTIADFDIDNELNLVDFTVTGRLIYDNKHGPDGRTHDDDNNPLQTDVLGDIRSIMTEQGFTASRATFSTAIRRSSQSGFDCTSYYGDSAMIMDESAFIGALKGSVMARDAGFGVGLGTPSNKLLCCTGCGYDQGSDPRVHLPASYSEPTVTNVHAYPCVEVTDEALPHCAATGGSNPQPLDATEAARKLYDAVWSFLQASRQSNYVVLGETNHNLDRHLPWDPNPPPPASCNQLTFKQQASQNVNGFLQSSLIAYRSNLVFRVWNNEVDRPRCFVRPNVPNGVNPPYDPNSQ